MPDGATTTPEPLYLSDAAIQRRFGLNDVEWRRFLAVLEQRGLPKPNPITGKRFWPAVRAFIFRYEGMAPKMGASTRIQEEEYWDEAIG